MSKTTEIYEYGNDGKTVKKKTVIIEDDKQNSPWFPTIPSTPIQPTYPPYRVGDGWWQYPVITCKTNTTSDATPYLGMNVVPDDHQSGWI